MEHVFFISDLSNSGFCLQISGYLKSSKVKQVMGDLALSQVAHKDVTNLTKSEYRRLIIGVQLIRDPSKFVNFVANPERYLLPVKPAR